MKSPIGRVGCCEEFFPLTWVLLTRWRVVSSDGLPVVYYTYYPIMSFLMRCACVPEQRGVDWLSRWLKADDNLSVTQVEWWPAPPLPQRAALTLHIPRWAPPPRGTMSEG